MRGKKLSKTVRDFDGVVGWCWLDIRCQFYHSAEQGGEKIKKKTTQPSWVKIKTVLKAKCHAWKERNILYLPSAGDALSLPEKQGFSCGAAATEDKCHYSKFAPLSSSFLSIYIWVDITCYGISLVKLGQLPWLCPLLGSFPPSGYWWGAILESHSWCSVSPAQQHPKLWCVINTFLAQIIWPNKKQLDQPSSLLENKSKEPLGVLLMGQAQIQTRDPSHNLWSINLPISLASELGEVKILNQSCV